MPFFLSRALTPRSFTFNLQFLYELRRKVHLSKTLCEIFHFQICVVFIFISLYFFSTNRTDSLTLKRHNFFQNKNNRKTTHSFAARLLIFKLQQEVWKFNDICMSWSRPKTDLETNFLNLKNRSLEYATFSQ